MKKLFKSKQKGFKRLEEVEKKIRMKQKSQELNEQLMGIGFQNIMESKREVLVQPYTLVITYFFGLISGIVLILSFLGAR